MKNKAPILSICIPTYNRANLIIQCLDSIVDQFKNKDIYNQVEIVISDNNSHDNTKEIINKYHQKYGNIRYYKNEKNLGSVLNTIKLATYASGKYIWIFSDDDLQYADTLKTVISVINRFKPDCLFCNITLYSNDVRKMLEKNVMLIDRDVYVKSKKELFTYLESKFFLALDWFTSYISGIIISKRVLNDNYENVAKMDPKIYTFPHIAYLFYNTRDYKTYMIAKTLIKYRTENAIYESGKVKNEREFIRYFYRLLFINDFHIYQINKNNMSFKFKLLLFLKYISRGIRVIFLELFRTDISRLLVRIYYGKYPLKLSHKK